MNYNAVLILEAIAKAPIPDEVKLKAVNDIEKMYVDKDYANLVWLGVASARMFERANLKVHHLWYKSDLGTEFWSKMNQIISQ